MKTSKSLKGYVHIQGGNYWRAVTAMAETAFRVLETVLIDSKVSTVAVQSVSNEVHVNEDKTVLIELISQPEKENEIDVEASVEVQVPKADETVVASMVAGSSASSSVSKKASISVNANDTITATPVTTYIQNISIPDF